MNKIIRKHYPASRLPAELRGNISSEATVEVIIEEEAAPAPSRDELIRLTHEARAHAKPISEEEAVARIRKLRDEWD